MKRRMYNPCITDMEQGTFTPLRFTTTGEECKLIAMKLGKRTERQ